MDLFGKFLGHVLLRNLVDSRVVRRLGHVSAAGRSMKHLRQAHLLRPGENDVLLQQVGVVELFKDDGNARQQLDLVQLHDTLEPPQQILLGLLVVVAELK